MDSGQDSIFDFVAIGELADTTVHLMALNLTYNVRRQEQATGVEHVEQIVLQQARDYLGRVREGFVLSVRTAEVSDGSELRYLLERVLLDWQALSQELDLAVDGDAERSEIEQVRNQLLAYGMAAIALGALPRLPREQITFPKSLRKPPTYADIPVPRSPAEMLQRIEELEEMIWQMSVHDLPDLVARRYDPLRRTYGFFESSAWLARTDSAHFGIKRRRRLL